MGFVEARAGPVGGGCVKRTSNVLPSGLPRQRARRSHGLFFPSPSRQVLVFPPTCLLRVAISEARRVRQSVSCSACPIYSTRVRLNEGPIQQDWAPVHIHPSSHNLPSSSRSVAAFARVPIASRLLASLSASRASRTPALDSFHKVCTLSHSRARYPNKLQTKVPVVHSYRVRGMATEVHSISEPPTLPERRSAPRLQLLFDSSTPHPDAHTRSRDEVFRSARGSFASPFTPTPLTPILASPVFPATTTTIPSTSANTNSAALPSDLAHDSGRGVKHKRSRSTLSRLHVSSPEDCFDSQNHLRSATIPAVSVSPIVPGQLSGSPPSPSFLRGIVVLDGIPIAKTPSPADDAVPRGVDFPTVSLRAPAAPSFSRPRKKSVRTSFTLGSDDEDDASGQRRKREAAAKAKKLERYDDLRRYHALMELLKTEARYLQDLRILTNVCATCCKPRVHANSSLQVYLQQLHHAVTSRSVASYFGTPAASFSKQTPSPSPSTFNSTPIQVPVQGQSTNPTPSPVHSPSTVRRRSVGAIDRVDIEKDLPFTRPIFTEEDIRLLCRNSNEILGFHECFVDDLKEALTPLGSKFRFDTVDEYAYVDMPRHDTLELAIQIIVSMFVDRVSFQFLLLSDQSLHFIIVVILLIFHHEITSYRRLTLSQAQSFKLYQSFCSTHSEAVELVQRARSVSPTDWEAWEKRCRKCVLDNHRCDSLPVPSAGAAIHFGTDADSGPGLQGGTVGRSLTTKNKRPHSFMASKPSRANTAPPHLLSRHDRQDHSQTPRLRFLDHMIKPIQRICKYHLLLDQLKSRVPSNPHSQQLAEGGSDRSRSHPGADADATFDHAELFSAGQTESLISHACEAMREVVNAVNDHRRKHEDRWKALLIVSRTVPSPPALYSSSPLPQLTSEVLTTLGNCLMSGALDVIYHRPTTSTMTKAKYLGAFLYEQGYLVLVKVGKAKAYEPQHWFPLKDFDVFDLNDEDGELQPLLQLPGR